MNGPTNGPRNGPERDLTNTLNRQAEQFARRGGTDLDFAQVASRAGEIRRGRRMRATMVMAAVVLAVAVPVGITTLGDPTKSNSTGPAASATPTQDDNRPLGLGTYDAGEPPKTGYYADGKIHGPSGEQPLAGGEPTELARMKDGFLIALGSEVQYLGDDGSTAGTTWTYGSGLVASPGRNVGALVQPDGKVFAVQDNGSQVFELATLPSGNSYQVAAVVGEDCSEASTTCTVYVTETDETPGAWAVRADGETSEVGNGFRRVVTATDSGLIAGQTSYSETDGTSCWKVASATDPEVWKTCDFSLRHFSPNGKLLLADPSDTDGPGARRLALLDSATGTPVLNLSTADNAVVYDAVWEDDEHVLATIQLGEDWAVLRIGLDGTREYALPETPGPDFVTPFKVA